MTFTIKLKNEISKQSDNSPESLVSLAVFLKYNSTISDDILSVHTENASVARWLFKQIKSHYNIDIVLRSRVVNRFKKKTIYILEVKKKLNIIKSDIDNTMKNILDSSREEKIAFIKGLFLSSGSINDPATSQYHLAFLVKDLNETKIATDVLVSLELNAKYIKRIREYMVYIKASEDIGDFINMMDAKECLFYFEDIRIYKDHKNMVNRLNNCEQANVEKTLKTSKLVLDNIKYLEEHDLLDLLEGRTKDIAGYKKKYPDTSLAELANIVSLETGSSITKSGISHHIRRINELADKHRNNTN